MTEMRIELKDTEWPYEYTDHDRRIARAIVFDEEGFFYFVRVRRDDLFGNATLIETSGGGAEDGESTSSAVRRELKEELGVDVDVITKIGVVSDYYNLIHRHNINHYYLCRIRSFGEKHMTKDEIDYFHLSTLRLTYDEAVAEYEKNRETKLGRLIANRELPVLRRAKELMDPILMNVTVEEMPLTDELLRILIDLSVDWENENSCYGYRKNERADIEGNRVFIVKTKTEVIGYLFGHRELSQKATSVMPDGTQVFELEELYVKPEYRRKNVGKMMFYHAEEAVCDDADYIMLSTATKNWRAILNFYLDELDMEFWSARLFKRLNGENPAGTTDQ